MPKLLSLLDSIEAIAACHDDRDVWDRYSWVYATDGVPLLKAQIYLSSSEDEMELVLNGEGEEHPAFVVDHGLTAYLEASTFADVLSVQKRQQPLSQLEDYADALEHYAKQDAFFDRGEFYGGGSEPEPLPGVSRDLYAEYGLQLTACPADHIPAAARATAELLQIGVPDALARCRRLPSVLGERIDARQRERIEARFASISLPLRCTTYVSFAWQMSR
ncbi:DUF7716 domain-containing protein [Achromobacter pestifer]|uniref:DUF7716 domain-containing protein n=1 Tax=Achromobacter pestifer TaxID=1353889 RepID=A0A6S6YU97_9BURK|nr:hypothetical protein [Achromobacter pestifer]CAB3643138.1 hypothetical protein LMG3431_02296 [Achromobacter pestifer]